MRKVLIIFIFLFLFLFLIPENSFAHGVGYRQSALRAISLEFFYSTGEEMSYREVKVFSPVDEKFAVQSGRTDEHGRFAFIPDNIGKWRIIVRDEEGHQVNAEIDISKEFLEDKEKNINAQIQSLPNGFELFFRSLLGVSIIFNIAMFIFVTNRGIKRNAHK